MVVSTVPSHVFFADLNTPRYPARSRKSQILYLYLTNLLFPPTPLTFPSHYIPRLTCGTSWFVPVVPRTFIFNRVKLKQSTFGSCSARREWLVRQTLSCRFTSYGFPLSDKCHCKGRWRAFELQGIWSAANIHIWSGWWGGGCLQDRDWDVWAGRFLSRWRCISDVGLVNDVRKRP